MSDMQDMAAAISEYLRLHVLLIQLEGALKSKEGGRYINYEEWAYVESLRSTHSQNTAMLRQRIAALDADARDALAKYAKGQCYQLADILNKPTTVDSTTDLDEIMLQSPIAS